MEGNGKPRTSNWWEDVVCSCNLRYHGFERHAEADPEPDEGRKHRRPARPVTILWWGWVAKYQGMGVGRDGVALYGVIISGITMSSVMLILSKHRRPAPPVTILS
jgi:hypothetical protein